MLFFLINKDDTPVLVSLPDNKYVVNKETGKTIIVTITATIKNTPYDCINGFIKLKIAVKIKNKKTTPL